MGIDCLLAHLLTWELYPMLSTKGHPTYVQPHPSTLDLSIWCFGSETLLSETPSTGQGSGIVWQPHCVPWNPHRRVCRQCQLCIQGSSMLKQLFNFLNPCVSRTSHLLLIPKSIQSSSSEYPQRFILFSLVRTCEVCWILFPDASSSGPWVSSFNIDWKQPHL